MRINKLSEHLRNLLYWTAVFIVCRVFLGCFLLHLHESRHVAAKVLIDISLFCNDCVYSHGQPCV